MLWCSHHSLCSNHFFWPFMDSYVPSVTVIYLHLWLSCWNLRPLVLMMTFLTIQNNIHNYPSIKTGDSLHNSCYISVQSEISPSEIYFWSTGPQTLSLASVTNMKYDTTCSPLMVGFSNYPDDNSTKMFDKLSVIILDQKLPLLLPMPIIWSQTCIS